jgi:hypothetical protein
MSSDQGKMKKLIRQKFIGNLLLLNIFDGGG